jgi:hypothetical protein
MRIIVYGAALTATEGSRGAWLSRTGIAILLRSGIGGSLRGLQSLSRGETQNATFFHPRPSVHGEEPYPT